jgi:hypothetical protein
MPQVYTALRLFLMMTSMYLVSVERMAVWCGAVSQIDPALRVSGFGGEDGCVVWCGASLPDDQIYVPGFGGKDGCVVWCGVPN